MFLNTPNKKTRYRFKKGIHSNKVEKQKEVQKSYVTSQQLKEKDEPELQDFVETVYDFVSNKVLKETLTKCVSDLTDSQIKARINSKHKFLFGDEIKKLIKFNHPEVFIDEEGRLYIPTSSINATTTNDQNVNNMFVEMSVTNPKLQKHSEPKDFEDLFQNIPRVKENINLFNYYAMEFENPFDESNIYAIIEVTNLLEKVYAGTKTMGVLVNFSPTVLLKKNQKTQV